LGHATFLAAAVCEKKQKRFHLTLTLLPRSDRVHVIALQCTELVHFIICKPIESLFVRAHVFYVLFLVESGTDLRKEAETTSNPL